MENRFYKTGGEFGSTRCLPKLKSRVFTAVSVCRKEPTEKAQKICWGNPEVSKQLIKELMQLVNTKAEYELLEQELAELEELFPSSSSSSLKGGAVTMQLKK